VDKLDKLRFRDFLQETYQQNLPENEHELTKLLQNMNLAADNGRLNLAGVLLFAEKPEWIKPQFVIKAISYPGNEIHSTKHLDTENFTGSLRNNFDNSLAITVSIRMFTKPFALLQDIVAGR